MDPFKAIFNLGIECALLKVLSSRTCEKCLNLAHKILGNESIDEETVHKFARNFREVQSIAIPGGTDDVLTDFSIK